MGRYDYFTQKQANILYRAVKQNKLHMKKSDISKMYNIVGTRDSNLSLDERIFRYHLENAINHYFNDRLEYAQAELDGHTVKQEIVKVGETEREATEDDFFYDIGEIIVEPIYETRWTIM